MTLTTVTVHGGELDPNSSTEQIRDLLLSIRLKHLRSIITVTTPAVQSRILRQVLLQQALVLVPLKDSYFAHNTFSNLLIFDRL